MVERVALRASRRSWLNFDRRLSNCTYKCRHNGHTHLDRAAVDVHHGVARCLILEVPELAALVRRRFLLQRHDLEYHHNEVVVAMAGMDYVMAVALPVVDQSLQDWRLAPDHLDSVEDF